MEIVKMECPVGELLAEDLNGTLGCYAEKCVAEGLVCSKKGVCRRRILGILGAYECVCNDNSDSKRQCTVCGSGGRYQEVEGKLMCISDACMTDDGILCDGQGECKYSGAIIKNYYCKCQDFLSSSAQCQKCEPGDPRVKGKCIPQECRSCGGAGQIPCDQLDETTVECSGNGVCVPDLLVILGLSDSNAGMCLCSILNMDDTCSECLPGYRKTLHEKGFECIYEECQLCEAQFCYYSEERNKFYCVCPGNYDPKQGCTKCRSRFTLESGCQECEPHYSTESFCSQCVYGFAADEQGNCNNCLPGFDIETECTQCIYGFDIKYYCKQCVSGMVLEGNMCVAYKHQVSRTLTVVLGSIGGVVALVLLAVAVVCLCRKRSERRFGSAQVVVAK